MSARAALIPGFVERYWVDHGYGPTVREVMDGVGYESKSSTHYAIRALAEQGRLRYTPGRHGGIVPVHLICPHCGKSITSAKGVLPANGLRH